MAASLFFRLFSLYFLLSSLSICVLSYSVDKKVYIELKNTTNMCFRQLNGTHQFGCSSVPGIRGNVGILHNIGEEADIDWLIKTGPHQPYIAMMEPDMFTRSVVMKLLKSGKVNGLLLVRTNKTVPSNGYSSDSSCPNQYSGMYSNNTDYKECKETTWNPTGSGFVVEDINVPVFIVQSQEERDSLFDKCWARNKPVNGVAREYPLCAAELKATMNAALNSESCHRRSITITNLSPTTFCDPLGDWNVYTTFRAKTPEQTLAPKSIVMAVTRLDSFSQFFNLVPGANSPVSSIVALLAASEVLGQPDVKKEIKNSYNDIMFAFFNGESYDYIGSSRMAYDMKNNDFRANATHKDKGLHSIGFDHLKYIVEVSQVGQGVTTNKLWLHTDEENEKKAPKVADVIEAIQKSTESLNVTIDKASTKSLPPASLQSFLKESPHTPGVVIADHDKQFTNLFYNSVYDEAERIQADYSNITEEEIYDTEQSKYLQQVATVVARSLYSLTTGKTNNSHLSANLTTVTKLLYCFLYKNKCDLFQSVFTSSVAKTLSDKTYPFYVGVDRSPGHVAPITKALLAYFTGDLIELPTAGDASMNITTRCKAQNILSKREGGPWNYVGMQGPLVNGVRQELCMKTLTNFSYATSPAFFIPGYDFSSGMYPTWTESVWDEGIFVRVFFIPSDRLKTTTLSVGVIIFLVSGIICYFINRRSHLLFPPTPSSNHSIRS